MTAQNATGSPLSVALTGAKILVLPPYFVFELASDRCAKNFSSSLMARMWMILCGNQTFHIDATG